MDSFHKILNTIDSIKEKISDLEYKTIVDELQNQYKNKNIFYNIKYIEYVIESDNEHHHITFPRQSSLNIGDEFKSKIVFFENNDEKDFSYLFCENIINQDFLTEYNIKKFVNFIDDSNPYSLSIIFIYSIEKIKLTNEMR